MTAGMRTKISTVLASIAFLAALVLVSPDASARRSSTDERTPSAVVTTSRAPRAARATNDADRYAQRESKARAQAEYRGGDFIVVGISGALLLVLLALVIIL